MSIILDVNWTKKYVFVHKCTFTRNKEKIKQRTMNREIFLLQSTALQWIYNNGVIIILSTEVLLIRE